MAASQRRSFRLQIRKSHSSHALVVVPSTETLSLESPTCDFEPAPQHTVLFNLNRTTVFVKMRTKHRHAGTDSLTSTALYLSLSFSLPLPSLCLCVSFSLYPFICLYILLSTFLPVHLPIYLPIYLPVACLPTYLSVYQSIYLDLSVHLSITQTITSCFKQRRVLPCGVFRAWPLESPCATCHLCCPS